MHCMYPEPPTNFFNSDTLFIGLNPLLNTFLIGETVSPPAWNWSSSLAYRGKVRVDAAEIQPE